MDFKVIGKTIDFGTEPALLLVDFMKAYTEEDGPFYSKVVRQAAQKSNELVKLFASRSLPIFHSRVVYDDPQALDGGRFSEKIPSLSYLYQSLPWSEWTSLLPVASSREIIKKYPSAFFQTPLSSLLQNCDSLVIAGCSTSGCVRASAVDALQHGLKVFVARDCVGDEDQNSHDMHLRDIQKKYGEVLGADEISQLPFFQPQSKDLPCKH